MFAVLVNEILAIASITFVAVFIIMFDSFLVYDFVGILFLIIKNIFKGAFTRNLDM